MNQINAEDLISYEVAAGILGVSRQTIYAMIDRDELHPIPIAERRYLSKEEVERVKMKKATAAGP